MRMGETMRSGTLLLVVLLLWGGSTARAMEVAGVKLPESLRAGEATLVLNGAGVRTRLLFKVYVAALYLPARQSQAEAILAAAAPRRVQLTLLRTVSADAFSEALRKGVAANTSAAQFAALAPRLAEFEAMIASQGEAREGATYTLDESAAGTQLSVNGKVAGKPVAGVDFFRALLSVWLGESPVQDDLKRALLGGR